MKKEFICIVCPNGCHISVDDDNHISGYTCLRGLKYVEQELKDPRRFLTSTFKVNNGLSRVCPCRSSTNVSKDKMFDIIKEIDKVQVNAPITMHQVIIKNVLNLGVDIIATKEIDKDGK